VNLRAAAALALAAAALGACYRVASPPPLGETVRVTVVINDARLVRAQAALQSEVAHALENRLGWRVSPQGTARLDLTLAQDKLASTGTDGRDIPVRWSITLRGHALLASRRGNALGDFIGTGYASSLADEPPAIHEAAREAAGQIAYWLVSTGEKWDQPPAAEPAPARNDAADREDASTDQPTGEGRR
jgi:hypothetical protein